MLNKNEFLNIMIGLCELFNKKPSEYIIDLYYEIFKDFSLSEVKKAFTLCVKSHKYNTLPKPAEILEFLVESKEDTMLKAWMQVNEAIETAGYYKSIIFKNPVISHCINELGGWQWLCSQERENMPFIEKRFYALYKVFEKRKPQHSFKLLGFIEEKNMAGGHFKDIPKPVEIGYEEETKMIEEREVLR